MKIKIKKLIQNQRGAALIFALMTLSVLLIVGTAFLSVNAADNRESIRQDDSLQAYYLAKSGATAMGTGIIDKSNSMSAGDFQTYLNAITNKTSDPTYIGASGGYFKVKVVNDASKGLGIISTGTMGNISKTVTVWMKKTTQSPVTVIEDEMPIDIAAIIDSGIDMSGSCGIYGSTYTNIDNPSNIKAKWDNKFYGDVFVSGSGTLNWSSVTSQIAGSGKKLYTDCPKFNFDLPQFPEFPELENKGDFSTNGWQTFHIAPNYYYPNITVQGSATLYIDTNNEDCVVMCDNLNVSGSGGIKINGTGTVFLIIRNSMSLSGSVNVSSNADNLYVFYMGDDLYLQGGATVLYGSFFAETASISVGGSARISDVIMTGGDSVSISGAVTSQSIYAPNASVSLSGSAQVKGIVLAEKLTMSGSTKITYDESFLVPIEKLIPGKTTYAFGAWE